MKSLLQILADIGTRKPERVERRSESRLPAHGLARICWNVEGEGLEDDASNLLGISSRGLSFRTHRNLALEQKIVVQAQEQRFEAVVRHSEPDGREFIIGAEILTGDREPLDVPLVAEPLRGRTVGDRKVDSSVPAIATQTEQHAQLAGETTAQSSSCDDEIVALSMVVAGETKSPSVGDDEDLVALSRLDPPLAVQKYQQLVLEKTGKKLTKTAFWQEAKYKHRSSFEKWQRKAPKASARARKNFERILREKPHLNK